jgi:uncharacterized membrane-anchored protein YhcB (DUF1043 family)
MNLNGFTQFMMNSVSLTSQMVIIVGSAVGAFILFFTNRYRKVKTAKDMTFLKSSLATNEELDSLLFEKHLILEAIIQSYEALNDNKIDTIEQKRLLSQYRQKLYVYNEKIRRLEASIYYVQISLLRDRLSFLLRKRITKIDQKLVTKCSQFPHNTKLLRIHDRLFVERKKMVD